MANSVNPDETAHDEPSHQDLHYLHKFDLICRAERVNVSTSILRIFDCLTFVIQESINKTQYHQLYQVS